MEQASYRDNRNSKVHQRDRNSHRRKYYQCENTKPYNKHLKPKTKVSSRDSDKLDTKERGRFAAIRLQMNSCKKQMGDIGLDNVVKNENMTDNAKNEECETIVPSKYITKDICDKVIDSHLLENKCNSPKMENSNVDLETENVESENSCVISTKQEARSTILTTDIRINCSETALCCSGSESVTIVCESDMNLISPLMNQIPEIEWQSTIDPTVPYCHNNVAFMPYSTGQYPTEILNQMPAITDCVPLCNNYVCTQQECFDPAMNVMNFQTIPYNNQPLYPSNTPQYQYVNPEVYSYPEPTYQENCYAPVESDYVIEQSEYVPIYDNGFCNINNNYCDYTVEYGNPISMPYHQQEYLPPVPCVDQRFMNVPYPSYGYEQNMITQFNPPQYTPVSPRPQMPLFPPPMSSLPNLSAPPPCIQQSPYLQAPPFIQQPPPNVYHSPQHNTPAEPPLNRSYSHVGPPPLPKSFPYIYVAESGLITVLLKNEVSVEMTIDRTIRLVNHSCRLVVATNSRGSASCLYHPGVRVCQEGTNTDVEIYGDRKARMTTDFIRFANKDKVYKFNYDDIEEVVDSESSFVDISRDHSVDLLFNCNSCGKDMINACYEATREAQCQYFPYGGFALRINGIKVTQTDLGDVIVTSWPKYLKIATGNTYLHVETHFSDISVDKNWNVRVSRGAHVLRATPTDFVLSNGRLCAGFVKEGEMTVYNVANNEKDEDKARRWRPNCPKGVARSLGKRTPREDGGRDETLKEGVE